MDVRTASTQEDKAILRQEMTTRLKEIADRMETEEIEIFLFYVDPKTDDCVSAGFLSNTLGPIYNVVAKLVVTMLGATHGLEDPTKAN